MSTSHDLVEKLISSLLALEDVTGYILISDPELYHATTNLNNFKLVLIESWAEIAEFIATIDEKCTVVLYGIVKTFIETGHSGGGFVKHHEFCAWELNKLFHKMFVKEQLRIIFNDGTGKDEKGHPLLWSVSLPNIRTQLQEQQIDSKISLRVIFIKWFEVVDQINDIP
ncbi:hypothetical protein Cantr_06704 [Candida viswanathii]|uniref:Uncharacterized protein n=1 Tax=Candida viswanathii TaxID=5486 RepID=A0A367XWB3_9ASCO|nr:hypothetical protein Cantr_06704 [Candida viswanathii]